MENNNFKKERNLDALYEILSDSFRRYLCIYLAKADKSVFTIEELAEQLKEWKRDKGDESISRKRVVIRLRHIHLPKLADKGIITYNPEGNTVQYDGNMELERIINEPAD